MSKRNCPFCGRQVSVTFERCPFCREAMAKVRVGARGSSSDGNTHIRRGLLWGLLAGVIYYFAGGHSGLKLPVEVPGFVNLYLTPILFLGGAGMALYGVFQKVRG